MSPIINQQAHAPRALSALANTEEASQLHLDATMSAAEPRSGLQRLLAAIASGPAVVMRRLSFRELFATRESMSDTPKQEPREPQPEEAEKGDRAEKQSSMAELLLYPLGVTVQMLSAVRTALGTTTSVVYFEHPEAPATPAIGHVQDSMAPASALKHVSVAELSPPKDEGSSVMALALERVATEVRRERQEAREDAQKQEEERHRKLAQARDAIHHVDMLNGIRNPAAEDIIRQMEGPYGISVETAMARMEDINRSEKK